jgi:hypothetical protein
MTAPNKKNVSEILEHPYFKVIIYFIQLLILIVGVFLMRTLNDLTSTNSIQDTSINKLKNKTEILEIRYDYLKLSTKSQELNYDKIIHRLNEIDKKFSDKFKESDDKIIEFYKEYELKRKK